MKIQEDKQKGCHFQKGSSLATSLILLVAIMLLGATTARLTVQGEKAARNERDVKMAFHAAEAALHDAEADINDGTRDAPSPFDVRVFLPGCGSRSDGVSHGLCASADPGKLPVWLTVDLRDKQASTERMVQYGELTGKALPVGEGPLPATLPRYLIELLHHQSVSAEAEGAVEDRVYRITAIGFGMRETTHVVLQTVYRRTRITIEPPEAGEGSGIYQYRSSRLSWREIPHWQELRDASKKK